MPDSESFRCVSCESVTDTPDTRIQLEVFLSSSFGDCTLKVKVSAVTYQCSISRQSYRMKDISCKKTFATTS